MITKRVAFFPGAFRPPHRNHYATVRHLLDHHGVDEVVIVVSGRVRQIPGTGDVLGPDVSVDLWRIFLSGESRASVQIADQSAVTHTVRLVESLPSGSQALLCTGVKDMGSGHGRFKKLLQQCDRRDIILTSVSGAPDEVLVRSSDLRAHLAAGERGRAAFVEFLPEHLTSDEASLVWDRAQAGRQSSAAVVAPRLASTIESHVGPLQLLEPVNPSRPNGAWQASACDVRLFVKHAGDDVADQDVASHTGAKPKKRLKTEQQALKWAARALPTDVSVPDVVFFDKTSRTLGLSAENFGTKPLFDAIGTDVTTSEVMERVGRALASLHGTVRRLEPFWDSLEHDRARWAAVRNDAISRCGQHVPEAVLDRVRSDDFVAVPVHLGLDTSNLLVGPGWLVMLDFESASTFGDASFDLGSVVADAVLESTRQGFDPELAITALIAGYQSESSSSPELLDRCADWAMVLAAGKAGATSHEELSALTVRRIAHIMSRVERRRYANSK